MKSAVAILTWNRRPSLATILEGITKHLDLKEVDVAVFEDGGFKDDTRDFLKKGATHLQDAREIDAVEYSKGGLRIFLGNTNLGVAGNTNRAINWLSKTGADHFIILNDDLHVEGDFVTQYRTAHTGTQIGLFCFNDFRDEESKWVVVPYRGHQIKLYRKMKGICMSFTRPVFNSIGYYDVRMGKFGEEHSEWTNRARMFAAISMDGVAYPCLDMVGISLRHQKVESTISTEDKPELDRAASLNIAAVSEDMMRTGRVKVPFALAPMDYAGGDSKSGQVVQWMGKYARVVTLGQ